MKTLTSRYILGEADDHSPEVVQCLSDVQCVSDVIKKKRSLCPNIRKNFLAVLTVHRGGIPDWVDLSLFLELLKQRSLGLLWGLLHEGEGWTR